MITPAPRPSARRRAVPTAIYVKVDSGLGRLGVPLPEAEDLIRAIAAPPKLVIERHLHPSAVRQHVRPRLGARKVMTRSRRCSRAWRPRPQAGGDAGVGQLRPCSRRCRMSATPMCVGTPALRAVDGRRGCGSGERVAAGADSHQDAASSMSPTMPPARTSPSRSPRHEERPRHRRVPLGLGDRHAFAPRPARPCRSWSMAGGRP
jgi:hypothetical protein